MYTMFSSSYIQIFFKIITFYWITAYFCEENKGYDLNFQVKKKTNTNHGWRHRGL